MDWLRTGMLMKVDEINDKGGVLGRSLEIVPRDDGGKAIIRRIFEAAAALMTIADRHPDAKLAPAVDFGALVSTVDPAEPSYQQVSAELRGWLHLFEGLLDGRDWLMGESFGAAELASPSLVDKGLLASATSPVAGLFLGLIGAALLYGDGAITPAISASSSAARISPEFT